MPGGGASVIYADTVGDLGYAEELGNYAEYSGGPNTAEMYHYARTLLDAATANPGAATSSTLFGSGGRTGCLDASCTAASEPASCCGAD